MYRYLFIICHILYIFLRTMYMYNNTKQITSVNYTPHVKFFSKIKIFFSSSTNVHVSSVIRFGRWKKRRQDEEIATFLQQSVL